MPGSVKRRALVSALFSQLTLFQARPGAVPAVVDRTLPKRLGAKHLGTKTTWGNPRQQADPPPCLPPLVEHGPRNGKPKGLPEIHMVGFQLDSGRLYRPASTPDACAILPLHSPLHLRHSPKVPLKRSPQDQLPDQLPELIPNSQATERGRALWSPEPAASGSVEAPLTTSLPLMTCNCAHVKAHVKGPGD